LVNQRLTFSNILEEIPIKIRINPLLNSVVGALTESHRSPLPSALSSELTTSAIPPTYSTLNIGSVGLTRNLEQLIEAVDNYKLEESNLAYLSRQIARERLKADQYVVKRREENVTRIAQGLAPLPEENVGRMFKIPPEPSRLESMLLLGQIDGFAKSLASASSSGLVTMYAAKASSEV
jgi:translation initiation factor 3 subunit H